MLRTLPLFTLDQIPEKENDVRHVIRPILVKKEESSTAAILRPKKKRNWRIALARDGQELVEVIVDNWAADLLIERQLSLLVFDGYPVVMRSPASCATCLEPCQHEKPLLRVETLHRFVFDEKAGPSRRDETGEDLVIHHKNENKFDARLKNLVLLTRAEHVRVHNLKRRKFGRRHRHDFGSLRYQPRFPSKLKTPENDETLKAMIGQKRPAMQKKPPTEGQRLFALEEDLAAAYDDILAVLRSLDRLGIGEAIPRGASVTQWMDPKTRTLGLRMPRMACDRAEAAFVLLYILHRLDLTAVARDLGEPKELLTTFLKRVSVNVAVDRWVRHERIPTVLSDRGWRRRLKPRR